MEIDQTWREAKADLSMVGHYWDGALEERRFKRLCLGGTRCLHLLRLLKELSSVFQHQLKLNEFRFRTKQAIGVGIHFEQFTFEVLEATLYNTTASWEATVQRRTHFEFVNREFSHGAAATDRKSRFLDLPQTRA